MTPAEQKETKQALLDTAEVLFGEKGFAETSLREISARAGTNLAAVNYHFGSKDGLLRAIMSRRFTPLNEERIRLMQAALDAAGEDRPDLERVLRAFIAPTFKLNREHPAFMQIHAWNHVRPAFDEGDFCHQEARFPELIELMHTALPRCVPGIAIAEVWWAVSFMMGAMIFTWSHSDKWEVLSEGRARYQSDVEMTERLVAFSAAGMRRLVDFGEGENEG